MPNYCQNHSSAACMQARAARWTAQRPAVQRRGLLTVARMVVKEAKSGAEFQLAQRFWYGACDIRLTAIAALIKVSRSGSVQSG